MIVDAAEEAMASHDPLLLDQALEAGDGSAVRVTHHLHQAGHHAVHVSVLGLCG